MVSAEVAVQAGDGLDQRQDPRPDGPPLRKAAAGIRGRESSTTWSVVGGTTSATETPAEKFDRIDSYVNERLAILASTKHGLTGRNWVSRFNYEWCTSSASTA